MTGWFYCWARCLEAHTLLQLYVLFYAVSGSGLDSPTVSRFFFLSSGFLVVIQCLSDPSVKNCFCLDSITKERPWKWPRQVLPPARATRSGHPVFRCGASLRAPGFDAVGHVNLFLIFEFPKLDCDAVFFVFLLSFPLSMCYIWIFPFTFLWNSLFWFYSWHCR